jgi:molybdopterin/thiamine biosynthesis adenylyltransferase
MNLDIIYSRPAKTAARLAEQAVDHHRFLNKKVLLTGESEILKSVNGQNCFLDAAGLLVRICPNITIDIPAGCDDLRTVCQKFTKRIAFGPGVEYRDRFNDFGFFDAILSVGTAVNPNLPWTTINSNGWLARVSSGIHGLPADVAMENPVGALAAASLGVGEVFKRLIKLKPERGELVDGLSFSLRTYRAGETDCGPALPSSLDLDLLLVAGGAIGNGAVRLLSQLPCRGRVDIVDPQAYGEENLGTCVLMGTQDIGASKAKTLADHLRGPLLEAQGFEVSFEEYAQSARALPAFVLNGLDNISARHQVQRALWPDVVVDGAIGDFMCQVSRHPWPNDVACLICLFREQAGTRTESLQMQVTGLPLERVLRPDALVSTSDVENAPVEKRDFLRVRLGRPICSVIQEGIAQKISEDQQQQGFEPSVPFAACFSACMVVAEMVGHLMKWPSVLAPRFQFDFLMGPAYGQELPQGRRAGCICSRQKNIERARASRKEKAHHFSIPVSPASTQPHESGP